MNLLSILSIIKMIILMVEQIKGSGNGSSKLHIATQTIKAYAETVSGMPSGESNDMLAITNLVNKTVSEMKLSGELPTVKNNEYTLENLALLGQEANEARQRAVAHVSQIDSSGKEDPPVKSNPLVKSLEDTKEDPNKLKTVKIDYSKFKG